MSEAPPVPPAGPTLRTPRLLLRPEGADAWSLLLQGERPVGAARLASSGDAASLEVEVEACARELGLEVEVLRGLAAHALLDRKLARVEVRCEASDVGEALVAAGFSACGPGRLELARAALPDAAHDWRRHPRRRGEGDVDPQRVTCIELPLDVAACAPPAFGAALAVRMLDSGLGHQLQEVLGPVRLGLGKAVGLSVFAVTAAVVVLLRYTKLGRTVVAVAPWPVGPLLRDVRELRGPWLLAVSCLWTVVVTVCTPIILLALALLRR